MAEQTLSGRIQEASRSLYREHLLAAAEAEFSRTSFALVKVSDIARRAEVSLATVYKNFGSKDELWDEVNAERMAEFTRAVQARTASIDSPVERLLVGARVEIEFFVEHETFLRLHLHDGLSWGTASALPDTGRGGQRRAWLTGMQMTTRTAQAAIDAGEIIGLRAPVVASLVISALQVWLTDWVVEGSTRSAEEVADEVLGHLRRCLVR